MSVQKYSHIRILAETRPQLKRLAAGRNQTICGFLDWFGHTWENRLLQHMTADEQARYLNGDMPTSELDRIILKKRKSMESVMLENVA